MSERESRFARDIFDINTRLTMEGVLQPPIDFPGRSKTLKKVT